MSPTHPAVGFSISAEPVQPMEIRGNSCLSFFFSFPSSNRTPVSSSQTGLHVEISIAGAFGFADPRAIAMAYQVQTTNRRLGFPTLFSRDGNEKKRSVCWPGSDPCLRPGPFNSCGPVGAKRQVSRTAHGIFFREGVIQSRTADLQCQMASLPHQGWRACQHCQHCLQSVQNPLRAGVLATFGRSLVPTHRISGFETLDDKAITLLFDVAAWPPPGLGPFGYSEYCFFLVNPGKHTHETPASRPSGPTSRGLCPSPPPSPGCLDSTFVEARLCGHFAPPLFSIPVVRRLGPWISPGSLCTDYYVQYAALTCFAYVQTRAQALLWLHQAAAKGLITGAPAPNVMLTPALKAWASGWLQCRIIGK